MLKKMAILLAAGLVLAACAPDTPHVIQASSTMPEVRLTAGMATQIEMPDSGHVQSVVVGNPSLVTAERAYNVVNLIPKQATGETNMIVRFISDDGDLKVYQYRVAVQEQ
jgi:hypothetical protein